MADRAAWGKLVVQASKDHVRDLGIIIGSFVFVCILCNGAHLDNVLSSSGLLILAPVAQLFACSRTDGHAAMLTKRQIGRAHV